MKAIKIDNQHGIGLILDRTTGIRRRRFQNYVYVNNQ